MKALLLRLPGVRLLVLLRMWQKGGEMREAAWAQLRRPRNLFQPFTTTSADRYPEEFGCVRETLGTTEGLRILSFGCASGDELITLLEDFPDAQITGIDINPLALRAAQGKVDAAGAGDRVTLIRAADADAQPASSYDAVLVLAVLRHANLNGAPPTSSPTLRFADFERTVTGLCRTVRPGGVFVIRHANFRFSDCAVAADFEQIRTGFPSVSAQGPTPVYGPDDRLLHLDQRDDGIYRRRGLHRPTL